MVDIGLDLAWGHRSPTGLAALNPDGHLIAAQALRTDAEIETWLRTWAPTDCLVAIDAPIEVVNASGARAADRLISSHFGRYKASCYPANTSLTAFSDGVRAAQLAQRAGLDVLSPGMGTVDPARFAARTAMEVYPHAALVTIFELPSVLTYKNRSRRSLEHLRQQMNLLCDLLQELRLRPVALHVDASPQWAELRRQVAAAGTKAALRRVEDVLDAIVCAYVARLTRMAPGGVRALGEVGAGCVITPVRPEQALAIDAAVEGAVRSSGPDPMSARPAGLDPQ